MKGKLKWYRVEAGSYRAEPTPNGSRWFARTRRIGGGWVYGTRIDGDEVILGERENLRQCKYACDVLKNVSDERLRAYKPASDPAHVRQRALALRS